MQKGNLLELRKISVLTAPPTGNVERRFSVLNLFSTKLWNTLAPNSNSVDKLMQLISMGPHICDLDRDEITDLEKFLKKSHSAILSWLFTFKDFEIKNII